MFRFIKEIFTPYLKCARLGHNFINKCIVIRRKTDSPGAICYDYFAEIPTCKKCKTTLSPNEEYKTYWSLVQMPESMWNSLKKKDYVIVGE